VKLYFVIPAYNEAQNLPRLMADIRGRMVALRLPYQVLLVDDGSYDGTAEVAQSCEGPIVVLRQANQGPGGAFRNGLAEALRRADDDDLIVTLEADNTSDLVLLAPMLERITAGSDAVLASVYAPGGGILGTAWHRLVLSKAANLLLAWSLGTHHLHTYSSFFRMHRAGVLRRVQAAYGERLIGEKGFVCMVELLIKLHLVGACLTEVPMVLDGTRRLGVSKMKIVRTLKGYGRVLAAYWRGDYRPLRLQTPATLAARRQG
jgi:dolichol-phosphate mannosyltransferase